MAVCRTARPGAMLLLVLGGLALYGRAAVLDRRAFAGPRDRARCAQDEVQRRGRRADRQREIEAAPGARPAPADRSRPRSPTSSATARFPADVPRRRAARCTDALFDGGNRAALTLPGAGAELRRGAPGARSRAPSRCSRHGDPRAVFASAADGSRSALVEAAPCARRLAALAPAHAARRTRVADRGGVAGADPPPRARAGRARGRARGRRDRRGDDDRRARSCSRRSTPATATRSSGTIWDAFLGDLRLWGARGGRARPDRRGGLRARTRGAWRQAGRRAVAPCGSRARGSRAPARCWCSPCCCSGCRRSRSISRWCPAAGVLVFSGRGRGRATLVRSIDRLRGPARSAD